MDRSRRELAALVALLRINGRPWHHYADLIEEAGSAIAVLEQEQAPEQGSLLPNEPPSLEDIELEIRAWEADGMRVVSVLDSEYPANLRTVHNRPPLLFVGGELVEADERAVAIVGTRSASAGGLTAAAATAHTAVERGFVVVSGLADGIDTKAHVAALEAGGRTLAVIGTGLRRVYPARNAALQQRLREESAVVSQFWPDAPPTKRSFPMRNAVMSGMSLATVVIEAGQTSGARIQARLALEHNRPVFLRRSLLEHTWARDLAELPGTYVIDEPAEVFAALERRTSLQQLVA